MRVLIVFILYFSMLGVQAQERQNGFVSKSELGNLQAWNEHLNEWTEIESFWLSFAKSDSPKFWGSTDKYPKYADVNEFDTLLIQLEKGSCLMQFFHSRWRRANDVQRWNEAFNEYGGCPYVFDE